MIKFLRLPLIMALAAAGFLTGCKPANPKTEQCTQIVSAATCQKIGQLLIVGFGGIDQKPNGDMTWNDPNGSQFKENSYIARDIADNHVGGIIFFNKIWRQPGTGKIIRDRNIESGEQLGKLAHALQAFNTKSRQQQHLPPLPLILALDQEGGVVNPLVYVARLPNYTPQAMGTNEIMHSSDSGKRQAALAFTLEYAKQTGAALQRYGINLNFAPDVDVNINPVNPIIGGLSRSYSDDPAVVANQAQQVIDGLHSAGVMATLKHFPGHGSSTGDTHTSLVDVTDTHQMDKELVPYKTLIGQGYADFIMSTHVINGQIDRTPCVAGDANDPQTWCPGTMSYKTLTELLRNQLHFNGVIVSDDMGMAAIAKHYPLEVALEKGLNAGVDMFIVSNHEFDNTTEFVNTIAKLVRDGKVPESRIDDAYQHVVAAKQHMQ